MNADGETGCDACRKAEQRPLITGLFFAGCLECRARQLALSPVAGYATDEEKRAALRKAFGDQWREWLPRVRHWSERFKEARHAMRSMREGSGQAGQDHQDKG